MKNNGQSVATLLRLKAENLIKNRPSDIPSHPFEGEILKLMHELEVYGVELELQNEEFSHARKEEEKSEKRHNLSEEINRQLINEIELNQVELEIQNEALLLSSAVSQDITDMYSDLFDFSTSGYLIVNRDDEIIDLNYSCARLIGKDRIKVKHSRFGFFVTEPDRLIYSDFLSFLFKNKTKNSCKLTLVDEESHEINVLLLGMPTRHEDQCLITVVDLTQVREAGVYRKMRHEILQILNEPCELKETLHGTIDILKKRTGVAAVGIRLKDGQDFPYFDQSGFSDQFLLTEDTLTERDKQGHLCRDVHFNPILGCTCGLVISGKADKTNPNFTSGGSWWINDTSSLLKIPSRSDDRVHPRNHCIHQGYQSMTLVPIRNRDQIVGLIQCNDYHKNAFSLSRIELLEGIASDIGSAMMRKQAEEALRKNEELLRTITENAPDIIMQLNRNGTIQYMNRALPGYTIEESIGKSFQEWTLPEYHEKMNHSLKLVFDEGTTLAYVSRGFDKEDQMHWYRSSLSPIKDGELVSNVVLITRDITDGILSEEIVQESEEKRNAIILSAMDAFFISDMQGCILEVNDTYCRMTGYTRKQMLGMQIQDLEVNEKPDELAAHIQMIMILGEDRFETCHRRKDGSIFNVEASVQYRKINGGQFITFLHDISKRKQAEEKLRQSERRYSALFANKINGMAHCRIITDENGKPIDYRILQINEAYERIIGIKKADIEGRRVLEVFPDIQHYAIDYIGMYGKIAQENGEIRFEEFFEATGQFLSIYAYCPVPDEFIAIFTDVTESRLAEKVSAFQAQLLSEVNDAVFSSDRNFRINYWNQAAERMFGWTREEAMCHISGELLKPKTDVSTLEEVRSKLQNEGYWAGEGQYMRKDGTYFFVEVNSKTLKDAEGKYTGQIVVVRDITERKRAEQNLQYTMRRFYLMLSNMYSGVLLMTPERKVEFINKALCDAYGITETPEELVGMTANDLIEKIKPVFLDPDQQAKRINQIFEAGLPVKGEEIQLQNGCTALRDFVPIMLDGKLFGRLWIHSDITERKKAEEALTASENEFRLLTESMPQIVWTTTADGQNTYFNHQWIEYTGMTLQESYGHGWNKPFHPDDQQRVWEAWQNAVQYNAAYLLQCRLRRFDGVYRWWLIHGVPVIDKTGKITKWYGTCTNIDEMKNAGDAILHNEKLLSSVIENVNSGVALIDETGKFVVYNPVFLKLFGLSPDSTIKNINDQDWSQWQVFDENKNLLHVDDHPVRKAAMTRKVVKNQLVAMKLPSGGDYIWMLISAEPLQKEDGSIDKIICTYHDITERKKAEEVLDFQARLLSEVHDAVFSSDRNFTITYWNQSAERIFGWTKDEALGKNSGELLKPVIEYSTRDLERAKLWNDGQWEGEVQYIRKDGTYIFVEVNSTLLKNANGKDIGNLVAGRDITIRKRVELAMRESEERFRTMANAIPQLAWIAHADGFIFWYNQRWYDYTGTTPEQMEGWGWQQVHDPEVLPGAMERWMHSINTGETFDMEFPLRGADGIFRPFLTRVMPLKDSTGRVIQWFGTNTDITEHKQAEQAVKESEARYRDLFDVMPSGVAVYEVIGDGSDFIFKDMNRAGENIDKVKREEIIGKSLYEMFPNVGEMGLDEVFRRVWQTGVPEFFPLTLYSDSKLLVWLTNYVWRLPSGELVALFDDITERKKAEEELRKSEQLYRAIGESINYGIWVCDANGKNTYASESYLKLVGMTQEECSNFGWGDTLHPDDAENTIAKWKECAKTGGKWDIEHRFKGVDGKWHPILARGIAMHDENGNITGWAGINLDISSFKQTEENLRQSEERYKSIFQNNHSVLLLINPDSGEIVDANPAACNYYGWSHEQLCSKNISDINMLTQEEVIAEMQKARKENRKNFHFRHQLSTNEIRDVEVYSGPVQYGDTILLYSIIHDITDRIQAEEAVARSEKKLSEIYASMSEGLAVHELIFDSTGTAVDYVITEINPAYERITGIKREDVIGKKASILYSIATAPYLELYAQVESSGESTSFETYFPPMDKHFAISVFSPGKGRFVTVFKDITEQKRSQDLLRESEFFFRQSQKAAFIGSFKTDFKAGVWESSEVLDQIFGIDKSYVRNIGGWNNLLHPDDLEIINQYLRDEVFRDGNHANKEFRIIRNNDRRLRWVHALGQVEYDSEHKLNSLYGTIQDITDRKIKEEALRKLYQMLAALNKSSQTMNQARDEEDYLNQVCQIIMEDTDFAMVWIGYAEEDEAKTIRPVASAGFNDNYLETIRLSWADNEYGRGPTGVAIRTGQMGICNNMLTDPSFEPWREQALKRGYASSIVFPLKSEETTFGAITIYSKETETFLDDEIKLLSRLAGDLAHGITTIRLRAAKQLAEEELIRSYGQLEELVKKRTAELLAANETLKLTEDKYRTVANFATNWEFWISPADHMIYCSPSCERITGYTATEFVVNSQLILDIIHPEDKHIYLEHKEIELQWNICAHEIQYRICRKDGLIRWIGHYCQPIYDESQNFRGIRGSNKDITARKKMEELLKTSNRKYSLLSANISDGIFIYKNGLFDYVNSAMSHIFGYSEDELTGMNLKTLVKSDHLTELEIIDHSGAPVSQVRNVEMECIRKDNSSVFVEFLFNYVAKEKVIYGVVHDITDKKQIQKNIVKAIIQTEENERSHFSKELHDGVGPLLSAIKLYLQWSERAKNVKSRQEIILKAEEILEETLIAVKEISNKLSPHLLTNYGLVSAIQSFINKMEESSAIRINFEHNINGRFDNEIEAALYRAVIECINNTVKYGHAKNITVDLTQSESQLELKYSDDGIGFDLNKMIAIKKGLGLFNLQNRIQNIGGNITLNSQPGKGVNYKILVSI